jgi:hypothetical protein
MDVKWAGRKREDTREKIVRKKNLKPVSVLCSGKNFVVIITWY